MDLSEPKPAPAPAVRRTGEQANRIARALRDEIVSGALKAGQPLRQERLAEAFETSRIPVREALRILESEGLVQLSPNKGACVAPLDIEAFREVYEMRAVLETLALRLAIPELTNRQIDHAAMIQEEAEASPPADFGALNKAFHMALYEPCARPRLLSQASGLNDIADRYLKLAATQLNYLDHSHREHHALLDACRRRDGTAACGILGRHIEDAGNTLYVLLSRRMSQSISG